VAVRGAGQGQPDCAARWCAAVSFATTGIGLVISSFVRTQVAALFAAGILTTMPAVQFSGMFTPVSSLSGGARNIGRFFPSSTSSTSAWAA